MPAAAAKVLEALGLSTPKLARDAYSLEQFETELARLAGLQQVKVRKRRLRYEVSGCTAEVSDVWADGKPTRTIAIESEDPAAVLSVGLGGYFHTNYARGLRALLDGAPEPYAVIDVGANSVKLHVAVRKDPGGWRPVAARAASLTVSNRGLRHGVLAERFGGRS